MYAVPRGIPSDQAQWSEGGILDGVHVHRDESPVGVLVGDGVHGVGVAGQAAVAGADGHQLVTYVDTFHSDTISFCRRGTVSFSSAA